MLKTVFIAWFLPLFAVHVMADYVAERKAAMTLIVTGKYQEAIAAFVKMAENQVSDFQKSDALDQASQCAINLKQYDQAMDLAKKVPLQSVSKTCQMRILTAERKWQKIVDIFGNETIENWPDEVSAAAFHYRGMAFYNLKDGQRAEKDLRKAVELLTGEHTRGLALIALGDTYQHLLENDELAIKSYRRAYGTAFYKECQAVISVTGILQRQKKTDAAVMELGRIDMNKVQAGYWRIAMLQAWGRVLSGQGKKPEAIAKYKEALGVGDISSGQKSALEQAVKDLQACDK
ncbi:MAG: hypothetical protein A2283_05330 [Lentisphaerae bacterium RIFOXYA12_FULL_48_11]|nr:MAG: hypothetical protein A2283_05330 [Lentisphaerae bacterium RIFOXYA12_FULL_48_11]